MLQIFLLKNPLYDYNEKALHLLKKRVFLCDNVDELLKKVNRYFEGQLRPLSDNSYLYHYLIKENTEVKILNLILKILT